MNEIAKFVASDHDVVAIIESSDMQEEFREKTIRNIIIDLVLLNIAGWVIAAIT